jgi:hypothetical protein
MAKDSPWFKFIPSEWNDGQISLCSYAAKGLFSDLIALYWSREGDLLRDFAVAKIKADADLWQELFARDIYTLNEGKIVIKFLDEQLFERVETSKKAKESIAIRWEREKQKASNQPKNTVVSGAYYDKNTPVKGSYYGTDTNKKEKEIREDIRTDSVGKSVRKDKAHPSPAQPLPLRAVGFRDGRPVVAEWKSYGEKLRGYLANPALLRGRDECLRALEYFWPWEIQKMPDRVSTLTADGLAVVLDYIVDGLDEPGQLTNDLDKFIKMIYPETK